MQDAAYPGHRVIKGQPDTGTQAIGCQDIGRIERKAAYLSRETDKLFTSHDIPHYCTRVGSMFCTYFTDTPVKNYQQAQQADTQQFARYFAGMLNQGIYLAPSQFEAGFLSAAHTQEDLDQTLKAMEKSLAELEK